MSRTTIVISDDILNEVRNVAGNGSVSSFVRQAVVERLERLRREALAAEMEAGYRAEAEDPSLDPDWHVTDTEGW
jgi:hypothetical protein